eukprot:NODE_111_length_18624_cov_1.285020.p5 type:complete len:303 gc:universal NODE_111_length_18624_cov_1.285020:16295-17203(+)
MNSNLMHSNNPSLNSMPSITQSIGSAVSLEELKVSDVKTHLINCKKFLSDYKQLCQQSKQFTQNANIFMSSFQDVINDLPVYEYSNSFDQVKECFQHMIKAQERFTQVMACLYVPLRQEYQTHTAKIKQTDAHYKDLKEKMSKKVTKSQKKLQGKTGNVDEYAKVLNELKDNAATLESVQQQHAQRIIDSTLEQTSNFLDVFVVFLHLHRTVCIPSLTDNVEHHLEQLNAMGIAPNHQLLERVMDQTKFSPKGKQLITESIQSARAQENLVKRHSSTLRRTNPNLNAVLRHAERVRSKDNFD